MVLSVDREFPGNAYLKYVANEKPINSEEDILTLQFKTVEPSGLLFHTQMGGGSSGDYVTVELYGGSLRYVAVKRDCQTILTDGIITMCSEDGKLLCSLLHARSLLITIRHYMIKKAKCCYQRHYSCLCPPVDYW